MFRSTVAVRSGATSSLFRRRTTNTTKNNTTVTLGAFSTRSYCSSKGVTATTAESPDSGRRECPLWWSQLPFPAHGHRTTMSGSLVTSHSQYRRRGFSSSSSSSSSSSTATKQDDTSDAVGIDCEEDFCAEEATTTASGAGREQEEEDNAGSTDEAAAANDNEDDDDTATQFQDEIAELKNQLLRSLAEQENIRAIARRDVQAARDFSTKSFAKSLLEVADNLERALDSVHLEDEHHPTDDDTPVLQSFVEGIDLTHTGLVKALAANGIVAYCDKPGDPFDADQHQALMEYPDPTQTAGTVGTVMKKGYTLNGRVLRAAEVGVIKK